MMRSTARLATIVFGLLLAADLKAAEPVVPFTPRQGDFVLACAGCHGLDGLSHSRLIPSLQGLVGYYLNLPEGRAYLSRLPNVAFAALNDQRLAEVLNYMVFEIGGGSAPAGAKPYGAAEVGKLRKQPLTEVTLSKYRQRMVETLIEKYHAPPALRVYGGDQVTASFTPATSAAIFCRTSGRPTRSRESSISSAGNQPVTELPSAVTVSVAPSGWGSEACTSNITQ
jgi:cytochrome c553